MYPLGNYAVVSNMTALVSYIERLHGFLVFLATEQAVALLRDLGTNSDSVQSRVMAKRSLKMLESGVSLSELVQTLATHGTGLPVGEAYENAARSLSTLLSSYLTPSLPSFSL